MILYRGENWDRWKKIQKDNGIEPKGFEFELTFSHDGSIYYDGSATFGSSILNAVNGHQICSKKFRTSGISTTPFWERARLYALEDGTYTKGVIFEININDIIMEEIELFEVNKFILNPKVKEDNEVIIKRKDNKIFQLSWFKIYEITI
jgi:hypothetical protein